MEIITLALGPVSNSYLVRGEKGSVLVDCGCYVEMEDYEKEFANKSVDPSEVKLVVITHGHFDHAGSSDVAKKYTKAPVAAHKNALGFIKEGTFPAYTPRNEHGQMFIDQIANPAPVDKPEPFEVDYVLDDSDFDLTPFGVDGKVIYTPGHTDSSVTVVLADKKAIVGDNIIADGFDNGKCVLGLICQDREGMLTSTKRLLDEGVETFYSGHGGPFTKEEVQQAYLTATQE
ncbi:MAG: MBL fold metallo-hydrolase [Erysipelotrichaceae bacterium]